MQIESLIAAAALVLAGFTYFAGVQRTKRQQAEQVTHERQEAERARSHDRELQATAQREQAIARVVSSYNEQSSTHLRHGLVGFFFACPEQLPDDAAVREAIRRVELTFGRSIWDGQDHIPAEVDLKEFFVYMRQSKQSPLSASADTALGRMRASGRFVPRPPSEPS